jgi:hypothetical protein
MRKSIFQGSRATEPPDTAMIVARTNEESPEETRAGPPVEDSRSDQRKQQGESEVAQCRPGLVSGGSLRPDLPRKRLSDDAWLAEMAQEGVSPVIAQAYVAFRHELPALLDGYREKWVAYRGPERLGFGESKDLLYRHYTSQGISRKELLVRRVRPGTFDRIGVDRS